MDDDERKDKTYNGFDNRMSVLQVNKNKLTKKTDGKCFGRGWGWGWGWAAWLRLQQQQSTWSLLADFLPMMLNVTQSAKRVD